MTQLAGINFNITNWELIIVLFLIGGGFLLGVLLGRDRIFLMLLGSYISYALMNVLPFKKIFPDLFQKEENFVIIIVGFLVLIGLIYFLFSRSVFKSSIQRKGSRSLFQIFFLSLFLMGIVLSVAFPLFPKDLISEFSPIIIKIFNTPLARVLWLVIPLIFIAIFKGKRSV
jgi:hypothetical protein